MKYQSSLGTNESISKRVNLPLYNQQVIKGISTSAAMKQTEHSRLTPDSHNLKEFILVDSDPTPRNDVLVHDDLEEHEEHESSLENSPIRVQTISKSITMLNQDENNPLLEHSMTEASMMNLMGNAAYKTNDSSEKRVI